jgi:hypothetical protein
MISDGKQIEALFKEVDHHLKTKVDAYLIRGSSLLGLSNHGIL